MRISCQVVARPTNEWHDTSIAPVSESQPFFFAAVHPAQETNRIECPAKGHQALRFLFLSSSFFTTDPTADEKGKEKKNPWLCLVDGPSLVFHKMLHRFIESRKIKGMQSGMWLLSVDRRVTDTKPPRLGQMTLLLYFFLFSFPNLTYTI